MRPRSFKSLVAAEPELLDRTPHLRCDGFSSLKSEHSEDKLPEEELNRCNLQNVINL